MLTIATSGYLIKRYQIRGMNEVREGRVGPGRYESGLYIGLNLIGERYLR